MSLDSAQDDDDDVAVRLEDQQHINQFGRLNQRMHDLEDDLKAKRSEHELLDDAANELILADDDEPIRYAFGECYYEVTKEQAEELLESKKEQVRLSCPRAGNWWWSVHRQCKS